MFKRVDVNEAKTLMANESLTILDLRDLDSFKESHIPSAQHVTAQELLTLCETMDYTTPILVYCYRGISCQSVAQHLIEAGFKHVYSLEGGFNAWSESHPTEN